MDDYVPIMAEMLNSLVFWARIIATELVIVLALLIRAQIDRGEEKSDGQGPQVQRMKGETTMDDEEVPPSPWITKGGSRDDE